MLKTVGLIFPPLQILPNSLPGFLSKPSFRAEHIFMV